jgi:hypothetical protein
LVTGGLAQSAAINHPSLIAMQKLSGLLVKIGGFGDGVRYILDKIAQRIAILGYNQLNCRFDVYRLLLSHR